MMLPPPTDGQRALVQKLGAEEWAVREEANAKLRKMDRAVVRALTEGLNDPDLEIRARCRRTLDSLLSFDSAPPWHGMLGLEDEIELKSGKKFKCDENLLYYYWLKVEVDPTLNHWLREDDGRSAQATSLFAKDMYKIGYSREDIEEIFEKCKEGDTKENYDKLIQNSPTRQAMGD